MKPYSTASERNKEPILEILKDVFKDVHHVLEIGSGTGQHAVHFGENLSHLKWQTSDLAENHSAIQQWLDQAQLDNVYAPIPLDVRRHPWILPEPIRPVDAVFSANTAHIMSWDTVTHMFLGVGQVLAGGGVFCIYGPFNKDGKFNSDSNRDFDYALRQEDPEMGIRDLKDLTIEADKNGLTYETEVAMPANNRIVLFRRLGAVS